MINHVAVNFNCLAKHMHTQMGENQFMCDIQTYICDTLFPLKDNLMTFSYSYWEWTLWTQSFRKHMSHIIRKPMFCICVGPGRKLRMLIYSWHGSYCLFITGINHIIVDFVYVFIYCYNLLLLLLYISLNFSCILE